MTGTWVTLADRPDPESGETVYDVADSGPTPAGPMTLNGWSWTTPLPAPCANALDAWWDAAP